MTTPTRSIYLLDPRQLRPEVIAVAFAKTSRSPDTFRDIAAELSDESSASFHEKWVVGYGHSSVAEHAVLHLAIENVSRLAIETIEANRLASYTEKSTRYQMFDCNSFYTPPEIAASPHVELYRQTCCQLFDAYQECAGPVQAAILAQYPRREGESQAAYDGRTRSKWMDHLRYLLPTATLANVGMTANARVLEYAIKKMLSHPLPEVREIGADIKRVAQAEAPTLVKYADPSPYLEQIYAGRPLAHGQQPTRNTAPVASPQLVDYDREGETRFIAACIYRWGKSSFAEALQQAQRLSGEERAAIIAQALAKRGPFDIPLRELEHITLTFDCVMDQGAYYEFKRHRMMTQTPQPFTPELGYAVPLAFAQAKLNDKFCAAVQAASAAYHTLAHEFPVQAVYVLTNAHNRRVLATLNLREAFHFCRLRGAPSAHFAIRRVAGHILEHIRAVYPALYGYMQCQDYPPPDQIERDYFAQTS
jgi:thymidylate synthase ThyX